MSATFHNSPVSYIRPCFTTRLRPHYYDIERTYTSNAIEGNTLSAVETTLVIEKGIAIGGKPLKDHLEALDHYDAIRYAVSLPGGIPSLMGDFAAWLATASDTIDTAFAAHRRLVNIHPFNDGNGRTARLLMNLILIRGGYPPVAVRPQRSTGLYPRLTTRGRELERTSL